MKYNKEVLTRIVKESNSIANVLKLLKLKPAGGNYKTILKKFNEYNIDTSHFLGMGWSKNKKLHQKYTKEEFIIKFLIINSTCTNTHKLKLKLFEFGLKEKKCEKCGQTEIWFGEKLSLHLDHINGVNSDYRLENLKVLCPNCHSQTSTYSGKNIRIDDYVISDLEIKNAIESSYTYADVFYKLKIYDHYGSITKNKRKIYNTPYKLLKKNKNVNKNDIGILNKNKIAMRMNISDKWHNEVNRRNKAAIARNADLVEKVKLSNIDFSKFGWVGKVAIVINKHSQKVNGWMKKYMPDIYENAFKRKF